jgi:hypothetical protein
LFIPLLVLAGVILLMTGLLALPFFLGSSGALTAFVRPDLVVIFHSRAAGKHGPFDTLLMATRGYVFCIPHARLPQLAQFVHWVAGGHPWEATSRRGALTTWTIDALEDSFRQRLADPALDASGLEHIGVSLLPPDTALALGTLASYRVETRAPRGFCYQARGGAGVVRVPIQSEADALALHRLLGA